MFLWLFPLVPHLASVACCFVGLAARGAGFRVRVCGARGGFVDSGMPGFSGVIAYVYYSRPTRQSSGRAEIGVVCFLTCRWPRAAYFIRWAAPARS
jgi:hypothetical protein